MSETRVRFAPSPTGYLHIGGARTALFNWLYARKTGGTFILRIEDTDKERSTEEATNQILDSMKWLGLTPDEGPFFQSQRLELYQKMARELLKSGAVYKCFCSKERLEQLRKEAREKKEDFVYDGACRRLSDEEMKEKEEAGEPYVLRFRVPDEGETVFNDAVLKEVRFDNKTIGDFVILRPDGHPTYNFCVVVDDVDMGISHVIRGAGHISNTPKQVLIYKALGADIPYFAHVPLILGPDKSKLSKRHGAASVMEYAKEGFFPEAVDNYLALLGWNPGTDEEIMSLERITELFDLKDISKANAVFDVEKLKWMNGMYFRNMPEVEAIERVKKYMTSEGIDHSAYDQEWLSGVISLFIERARTMSEMIPQMHYFFSNDFEYDPKGIKKVQKKGPVSNILKLTRDILAEYDDYSQETLEKPLREMMSKLDIKFGQIAQPVRLALTGGLASPGLFDVMQYLGKETCLKRLDRAIAFFKQVEE